MQLRSVSITSQLLEYFGLCCNIEEYDLKLLFRFVQLFSESNLAKLLVAYFAYRAIPMVDESDSEKDGKVAPADEEDEDYAGAVMARSSNQNEAHSESVRVV